MIIGSRRAFAAMLAPESERSSQGERSTSAAGGGTFISGSVRASADRERRPAESPRTAIRDGE